MLALGDSLTFGFQESKFLANPDPTNFATGFVDDFVDRLSATPAGRDVRVVNFGCPGETTSSFLAGPCAYHAFGFSLHDNFTGSQMAAAEAFLAAHRGHVGPILISLGANDILAAVTVCGGVNPQCLNAQLPGILAAVAANYETVLARLRAAAPDAEIIAVALYNPTPSSTRRPMPRPTVSRRSSIRKSGCWRQDTGYASPIRSLRSISRLRSRRGCAV